MFWVTHCLGLGPYPLGDENVRRLRAGGVTHVLNVTDGRGPFPQEHFEEVAWHRIEDLKPIPIPLASVALRALHRMLTRPGPQARVYVHCSAGQNRSPTLLWLYLVACGSSPADAAARIGRASFDACPGHPALVGPGLLEWALGLAEEGLDPPPPADLLADAESPLIG